MLLNKKKSLFFFSLLFFSFLFPAISQGTPLDDYIAIPDNAYGWNLQDKTQEDHCTIYHLQLTSQQWRSFLEVDSPIWTHALTVIVPDTLLSPYALLRISGGINSNDIPPQLNNDKDLAKIAVTTCSVIVTLRMVPNQYLKFPDENNPRHLNTGRKEDALVAYTWNKFFQTQDPYWPLLLPMTKSVVRAMDAIQSFCASSLTSACQIKGFILAGASKRGWATWLTAAVDPRVKAIIPIVMDALNSKATFIRSYQAYGVFPPILQDFIDIDIASYLYSSQYHDLMNIEEPFAYFDRLTLPKYIINASGDEFFLPDSSQQYFHILSGEKNYLRYIPNANHDLRGTDAEESALAFYLAILYKKPLPKISWTFQEDNTLVVQSNIKPLAANLWQASNSAARDFRVSSLGKEAWTSELLTLQNNGTYAAGIPPPTEGWKAFFVELVYDSEMAIPYKFTTDVFVIPDSFAYEFPNPH